MSARGRRRDAAHHHPRVRWTGGAWSWACPCGAACTVERVRGWHAVLVEALLHSSALAP